MRDIPRPPVRRALSMLAVMLAIGGTACQDTPVTLGTTLTLTVNVNTCWPAGGEECTDSGGGDFPASYAVTVTGPYETRESLPFGESCDDPGPSGFGTVRTDIPVPAGSTTPFQVSTRFEDLGPAECYQVTLRSSELPDNCEVTDSSEGVRLRESNATHDFDVICGRNRIEIVVESTGDRGDMPDSYVVAVDGGLPITLTVPASSPYTATETVMYLGTGSHTVDLTEPPTNCSVSPGLSITEQVDLDETVLVTFTVDCQSSAINATIRGVVRDTLSGPGLEGVYVQAIHETSGGLPPVQTDALGEYEIAVSETGVFTLCAIAAIPPGGVPQRFVNTNCVGEEAVVTNGSVTETLDLSIETGYYLAITGGPFDYTVAANDPIPVTFDYRAWHRTAVSQTTTWVVIGLEVQTDVLDGQDTALGQNPGPFGAPTAAAAGSAMVDLTAPGSPGTYDIYARLLSVQTDAEAIAQFESGFPNAKERNYIKIGTVTVSSQPATVPSIVFSGDDGGTSVNQPGVWGVESDGLGAVYLFGNAADSWPTVSPDGGAVAYSALGPMATDIFLWDASTSMATNLSETGGSLTDGRPSWSPAGDSIIFEGGVLPSGSDLFVVPADGSSPPVNLTASADSSEFEPDWGSDGVETLVVYRVARIVGTRLGLRLLKPSSGTIEGLTSVAGDEGPVISPDGTQVAFSRQNGATFNLWVIDIASKTETQITTGSWADRDPDWSPDGLSLVFETNRTADGLTAGGLAIVDVASKVITPLIDDGGAHVHPTWHP